MLPAKNNRIKKRHRVIEKPLVPGLGSSADLPIQPRSRDTVQARTVAARNSTDVIRKATGIRKTKSSKRKRKNNKQRG